MYEYPIMHYMYMEMYRYRSSYTHVPRMHAYEYMESYKLVPVTFPYMCG